MMMSLTPLTSSVLLRTSSWHLRGTGSTCRTAVSVLTQLSPKSLVGSLRSLSTQQVNVPGSAKLLSNTCTFCAGERIVGNGAFRYYSSSASKPKPKSSSQSGALQEASESRGGAVTLTTAEKVKENVKTVSYGGVIVVGVVIGGAMLYFVLNELFSSESPNNIYSHAFKLCKLSTEVQDTLGTPIKCYGEETRRGWRRHVACQEFLVGETKFLRMRFYIEGTFKKGTVNLEKKTNDRGKYEYTYLSVDVDGYPPRRIEVPF